MLADRNRLPGLSFDGHCRFYAVGPAVRSAELNEVRTGELDPGTLEALARDLRYSEWARLALEVDIAVRSPDASFLFDGGS